MRKARKMTPKQLRRFFSEMRRFRLILEQAADDKYLVLGEKYDRTKFPLAGHCGVVAHLVKHRYGGDMVFANMLVPPNRLIIEQHIWNKLPDGTEVDLTSDQFGGDGVRPRPAWLGKGHLALLSQSGTELAEAFEKTVLELEKRKKQEDQEKEEEKEAVNGVISAG